MGKLPVMIGQNDFEIHWVFKSAREAEQVFEEKGYGVVPRSKP